MTGIEHVTTERDDEQHDEHDGETGRPAQNGGNGRAWLETSGIGDGAQKRIDEDLSDRITTAETLSTPENSELVTAQTMK